jgi:putative membrane protein
MRFAFIPAALLTLLVSCSSGDRTHRDTGMADNGAGGFNSRDTIPTGAASAADTSTGAGAAAASESAGILSQLNVANTTEIQLATLAAKKATSPHVKQIATRLAADHSKNREQLRALAQKLNLTLTPDQGAGVSAAGSAVMPPDLQGKTGRGFDRAFIQQEINDHQSNIEKLQTQVIPSAQNVDIKAYLEKTLAAMQGHLASLKQVQQQLRS